MRGQEADRAAGDESRARRAAGERLLAAGRGPSKQAFLERVPVLGIDLPSLPGPGG